MTSLFNFRSNSASSILLFRASMAASIDARASFTICPTLGLSCGATSFMDFKRSVSCPFFPSTSTRIRFKSFRSLLASNCSRTCLLICSNFSLIISTSEISGHFPNLRKEPPTTSDLLPLAPTAFALKK